MGFLFVAIGTHFAGMIRLCAILCLGYDNMLNVYMNDGGREHLACFLELKTFELSTGRYFDQFFMYDMTFFVVWYCTRCTKMCLFPSCRRNPISPSEMTILMI